MLFAGRHHLVGFLSPLSASNLIRHPIRFSLGSSSFTRFYDVRSIAVSAINFLNRALSESRFLKRVVAYQHRIAPVPISIYAAFFASRMRSMLFGWYSTLAFHASFDVRASNGDYWSSRESLYWYLGVARHQIKAKEIDALFEISDVAAILRDRDISVLDIGCGVMKEESYMARSKGFLPRRLIGLDLNRHLEPYAFTDPRVDTTFLVVDVTQVSFADIRPDVVFFFGGVIEFLSLEAVTRLFSEAVKNGVKLILIIGEGSYGTGVTDESVDHRNGSFCFQHDIAAILASLGNPQRTVHANCSPTGNITYLAALF
jgi:hypothetical protein